MTDSALDEIKSINIFKENCKFHHIGLSVKSINSLFPKVKPIVAPIQKVKVAFVKLQGVTIELLEPLNETSPIYNNLKNGDKNVINKEIDYSINRHKFRCCYCRCYFMVNV